MSIGEDFATADMTIKRKPRSSDISQHRSASPKKPKTSSQSSGQEHGELATKIEHWLQTTQASPEDPIDTRKHVKDSGTRVETVIDALPISTGLQSNNKAAYCTSDSPQLPLTGRALKDLCKMSVHPSNMPSSKKSKDTDGSSLTKKSLPNGDDPLYIEHLIKRGICLYHDLEDYGADLELPVNIGSMKAKLQAKRKEADPTSESARTYGMTLRSSRTEKRVEAVAVPLLLPIAEIERNRQIQRCEDLQWSRDTMIGLNFQPAIAAPKPDITIGWDSAMFSAFANAIDELGAHARPIATEPLVFPLFAIEAKGEKGSLRVARLQSLHNGATILSNLLYLRRNSANSEANLKYFFNRIHVLSFEITDQCIHMSGYWATSNPDGGVAYHGTMLAAWCPFMVEQYKEAHRYLRNAMEWVRESAYPWIVEDLKTFRRPAEALKQQPSNGHDTPSSSGSSHSKPS